jgi:flagellin-like hook-associated protein FlgL
MDVNSINNNISTLNTSSSLQLEKTSSNAKINSSPNDELNLFINDYNKKRDELSQNVQSLNDGIASIQIAQNSIEKQQDYLKNIQNKLENIDSYENKNDIKQSINEDLRSFNQIAYQTNFKKEALLVTNNTDDKTNIDVNTKTSNFSMPKPNTSTYANKIFEIVNNSDLNNSDVLNDVMNSVTTSSSQLQNTYKQFGEFGNILEVNARETIKEQIDLLNENKINKDFGKDSSDFSKTNVSANLGYLAASQANIVQAQSVRLLS